MFEEISKTLTKIPEGNLEKFAQILIESKAHRICLAGNGGSSATASHFASDLSALGFDTICLTDSTSKLTALTNDFGWDSAYLKQLVHLKPEDVFIAISVHGGDKEWSNNLVKAALFSKDKGAKVLSLLGCDGGELVKISDCSIIVSSDETYVIEGIHSVLAHAICQKVKEKCSK